MTNCLFCNEPEPTPGYRISNKDVEFVCSRCVQILLGAEQLHLRRAYEKAIDKGYHGKGTAIKSFLIQGGEDGQRPEKHRRHFNRKGIARTLGSQAQRIGRHAT